MSVNDKDRAAAEALFRDLAEKNKLAAVFSLSVSDVDEHFARHREAERERCVKRLRQFAADADASNEYGRVYMVVALRNAADVLDEEKSDGETK